MGPVRVLGRKSTCLCPCLRRTTEALSWSFLPEQMWDTDSYLGTLSASEPTSRVPNTHPSGPTAGSDHLRRGERKNQQLSPATSWLRPDSRPPHLLLGISQPRHSLLPIHHVKPSRTCSCPAGEPSQAQTASRIGSKGFPRGQGPSCSSQDLPVRLHPLLQLFRGLNLNLKAIAFSVLLNTLISLPQSIRPCLLHWSASQQTFTASGRGFSFP